MCYVWTILLLEILLEKFKLNKDKMRHEEDNKDADTAHTCALARAPTHTHTTNPYKSEYLELHSTIFFIFTDTPLLYESSLS